MNTVRTDILQIVRSLIVGPIKGSDETLTVSPDSVYLSGILYNLGDRMSVVEDDDGDSVDPEGGTESHAPVLNTQKPRSIGITVTIKNGDNVTISIAGSARYKSEIRSGVQYWKRHPLVTEFKFISGSLSKKTMVSKENHFRIHAKERPSADSTTYTFSLINEYPESENSIDVETYIFQSTLSVRTETKSILSRRTVKSGGSDDSALNEMLYRSQHEFAVGHGVSTVWEEGDHQSVDFVSTSWMPVQPVYSTSAEGHPSLIDFKIKNPDVFKANWLATGEQGEVCKSLDGFAASYEDWINIINQRLSDNDLILHREIAEKQIKECRLALLRIRLGIDQLRNDSTAWRAFQSANQAMDNQSRFKSKGERSGPLILRPFQLAFVLVSIESICDVNSKYRGDMDLLWFPTGGGKTEAYLLLTAFTIFYQRLKVDIRRSAPGVDVLMRYTLRLLTVQQFQRAASVIVAAEFIRRDNPQVWGVSPITIGLLVGGDTTPNKVSDAIIAINSLNARESVSSSPCILVKCPVCGRDISSRNYTINAESLIADCGNDDCNLSKIGGFPCLTIDEHLSTNPPSLLLGTVDKFAQLPRSETIGNILLSGGNPPSLIIQDELHLISGPLGSISGVYETVIDHICSSSGVIPKIIGSSATIGGAKCQVRRLFDRETFQFPPSGIDANDSYFAIRDMLAPNRLYVGVSTMGRSPKFTLQFVEAAIMQAAKTVLSKSPQKMAYIDPYWSLLIYYNTIRELGAGVTMSRDDVPMSMKIFSKFLDEPAGSERNLITFPMELSSNVNSSEIPKKLKELERPLNLNPAQPAVDVVLASNIISVGLDIPRLGVMIMNQQPKTTSEYIQATSRVGRGIPGLIFTINNTFRPRDASHFEHFSYYHRTLYMGVESNSVTPWSPRARDKCLIPMFVALVRYSIPGMREDRDAIKFKSLDMETQVFPLRDYIIKRIRASSLNDKKEINIEACEMELNNFINKWVSRANWAENEGFSLVYWRKSTNTKAALLRSAEDPALQLEEFASPNSMRDVEPSTAYILYQNYE